MVTNDVNKKCTMLTWYFPPWNQVASRRPASWAQYLAEDGWEVTVVTPKKMAQAPFGAMNNPWGFPDKVTIDEKRVFLPVVNRWLTRPGRLYSGLRQIWQFLQLIIWLICVFPRAYKHAAKSELLITTFGPWTIPLLGGLLKRLHPRLYWLCDFRDLWSNRVAFERAILSKYTMMQFAWLERWAVAPAELLTTVTEPLVERLKEIHSHGQIECIYNGHLEDVMSFHPITPCRELSIVYTGGLYKWYYDVAQCFDVLQKLDDTGVPFKVHFYGDSASSDEVAEALVKYPTLRDRVILHSKYLSKDECKVVQQNADVLLFLAWNDDLAGVLSGKVFEYLVSGRPVWSFGGGGNNYAGRFIERAGCGRHFAKDCICESVSYLVGISKGEVPGYSPDEKMVLSYHRRAQFNHLARIMYRAFPH